MNTLLIQKYINHPITQRILKNHAKQFIDSSKCLLIGPIPAIQSKVRGSYHHHLLIQANTRTRLNKLLAHLSHSLSKDKNNISNKVRWSINVDPLEF